MAIYSPEQADTREADWRAYRYLKQHAEDNRHGDIFDIRDFHDDEFGVTRLDTAFLPLREDDSAMREQLVRNVLPVLIPPESFGRLITDMTNVIRSQIVVDHFEAGGSVVFASNHISYADQSVLAAAAAECEPDEINTHTTFIHRQVSLFQMKGTNFKVVDDGLLYFTNIMQTFPNSESGKADVISDVRGRANTSAMKRYLELIRTGRQRFFMAPSGTGDKVSEQGQLVMAVVEDGAASVLTSPNRHGRNRLLAIPLFMDCNPFMPDGSIVPHETPFQFLEPRFLQSHDDVQHMMHEIATVGNQVKRPSTPTIVYAA